LTGIVPQKEKGNWRGRAVGAPDEFHPPELHNTKESVDSDSARVDQKMANEYRFFRSFEANEESVANPWRPLEIDPTMRKRREQSRHLVFF